jgi:flagellar biogenesis protein FliO
MKAREKMAAGGLTGWLLERFRKSGQGASRLELVERITLAPRQSLALVEAEGRRILVATSPEGAPAFFALDDRARIKGARARQKQASRVAARVSW